ncbi:antifreeze protein [Citreimonas sp.]|uniref:antifreeze protein n=1 Tax=Citreimonas sp. TaxID=3036715 RepID=UPI0035C8662F
MIDVYAPYRLFNQNLRAGMMIWDVQTVMALRLMGLAGAWTMPPGEAVRMVTEKPPAFAKAWTAWQTAMLSGRGIEAAGNAFNAPLSRKARGNRRRLTRVKTRTGRT